MKKILSYFLCFLLIQFIVIFLGIQFVIEPFLHEKTIYKILDESNFYSVFSIDIQNGFQNYIFQSGLPENIIDNLYTQELAKQDIDKLIRYAYNGEKNENNYNYLKQELDSRINDFLVNEKREKNSQMLENITKFENLFFDEYNKTYSEFEKVCEILKDNIKKVFNYVCTFKFVVLAISAFLLIIVSLLNLHNISEILAIIGLAVGGIFIVFFAYLNKYINIESIVLYNLSISSLVKYIFYYVTNVLKTISICSFSAGILGILLNISKKEIE